MLDNAQANQKLDQNASNLIELKDFFKSNTVAVDLVDKNLQNISQLKTFVNFKPLTPELRRYPNEDKRLTGLVKETDTINYFINPNGSTQDANSWSLKRLPTPSDIVVILPDATAKLEGDNFGYIWRVDGTLTDNTDNPVKPTLTVDTIFTMPESTLIIRDADFKFISEAPIDLSRDQYLISRGMITQGKVDIKGQDKKVIFYSSQDILPGQTSIKLDNTIFIKDFDREQRWRANDRILLLTTTKWGLARNPAKGRIASFGFRDEVAVVANVLPDNTIELKTPTVFDHTSLKDPVILNEFLERTRHIPVNPKIPPIHEWAFKPLIANMSRTVNFEGDPFAPSSQRPHILHLGSDVEQSWTAIKGFGRTKVDSTTKLDNAATSTTDNVWGRFPLSLDRSNRFDSPTFNEPDAHFVGNVIEDGLVVGNVKESERGIASPGDGIVVINANAVVEANLVFNTTGSAILYPAGTETGQCVQNICGGVWGQNLDGPDENVKTITGGNIYILVEPAKSFCRQPVLSNLRRTLCSLLIQMAY